MIILSINDNNIKFIHLATNHRFFFLYNKFTNSNLTLPKLKMKNFTDMCIVFKHFTLWTSQTILRYVSIQDSIMIFFWKKWVPPTNIRCIIITIHQYKQFLQGWYYHLFHSGHCYIYIIRLFIVKFKLNIRITHLLDNAQ